MQRIRINKTPAPGTQRDYSLVGNTSFTQENPNVAKNTMVKNTMGATDRDQANIEVEGGETAVGDINGDGFLEHFTFKGKRHSQGGMPVNLPEDAFVYSDTPKMRIKDEEVQKMFGMSYNKQGYTPAAIAKKFQVNEFIAVLKDDEEDEMSKRTAGTMLKNNMEKLAMLALIQESMKGFPDGVPAIAQGLMEGMGGGEQEGEMPQESQEAPQEEMMDPNESEEQMMRYGGIPKAQFGLASLAAKVAVRMNKPKTKAELHKEKTAKELHNASQLDWRSAFSGFSWDDDVNAKAGKLSQNKKITELELKMEKLRVEKEKQKEREKQKAAKAKQEKENSYVPAFKLGPGRISNADDGKESDQRNIELLRSEVTKLRKLDPNTLSDSNKSYLAASQKKLDSYDKGDRRTYLSRRDVLRDMSSYASNLDYLAVPNWIEDKLPQVDASGSLNFDNYRSFQEGSGKMLQHADGSKRSIGLGSDGTYYYKDTGYPAPYKRNGTAEVANDKKYMTPAANTTVAQQMVGADAEPEVAEIATPKKKVSVTETPVEVKSAPTRVVTPRQPPVNQEPLRVKEGTLNYEFEYGGEIPTAAFGTNGIDPTGPPTTVAPGSTRPDPNAKIPAYSKDGVRGIITGNDGVVRELFYVGPNVVGYNADGSVYYSAARKDGATNTQYGGYNMQEILAKNPNTRYTKFSFGTFKNQPVYKNTGVYMPSNNAASRTNGDLTPEEWSDFEERHGALLNATDGTGYSGGYSKFKQDLQQSKATGNVAAEWFQDTINKKYKAIAGVDYFGAENSGNPYTRDKKFGVVTFSVPNFYDAPASVLETPITQAPQTTQAPVIPGPLAQAPKKNSGPWWLQDINTFTGAMTDEVNRYDPLKGRVALTTPGYVLNDPSRMIAAVQESANSNRNQAFASLDGNTAMAGMLGDTGEMLAQQANNIGGVENQNVGIVNQAFSQNAQMENREIEMNANFDQKYAGEVAMLNQNYDKESSELKWRRINAFNTGTTNWFKKKQMEQVLFPQVTIDSLSGDASFSGTGRDPIGFDTYSAAYNSPKPTQASAQQMMGTYDAYLKATNGDKDLALKLLGMTKGTQNNRQSMGQQYGQANGFDNSMDEPQMQFGGYVTPWDFDN
jgi:hypothetical protein